MKKAKKSLSQNFLIDKNICNKILIQTEIKNKNILEIGPGYGFLTDFILNKKPKKLILVEKDSNLVNLLKEKYKNEKRVLIIEDDILNKQFNEYKNLIIISNLPYNIATKVILHIFKYNQNISEMILMIQKEVSEKFDYNLPQMNKYKFFTKLISVYLRCFDISNKVFIPRPKVKSTVVKFKFYKKNIDYKKAKRFADLIFRNVRKKISNNIIINKNNKLLDKRVDEISIDELLIIYNLF